MLENTQQENSYSVSLRCLRNDLASGAIKPNDKLIILVSNNRFLGYKAVGSGNTEGGGVEKFVTTARELMDKLESMVGRKRGASCSPSFLLL